MRLDSQSCHQFVAREPFFVVCSVYMFSKFGLDLASWSKVIVLGKEQEDDDTQKDFCARGRTLHG